VVIDQIAQNARAFGDVAWRHAGQENSLSATRLPAGTPRASILA